MKLISMTDFVLGQSENYLKGFIALNEYHSITLNYANFLKQPLTLGMFVPVDEDGNIINDPGKIEYNKAKSKVLFKIPKIEIQGNCITLFPDENCFWYDIGFKSFHNDLYMDDIEGLIIDRVDITLTETAIKMIYGN